MSIQSFLTVWLPNGERRALPVTPETRIQWEPATGEVYVDHVLAGKRDPKIDLSWQSLQPTVTLAFTWVEPSFLEALSPYPEHLPEPLSIQRLRSPR